MHKIVAADSDAIDVILKDGGVSDRRMMHQNYGVNMDSE